MKNNNTIAKYLIGFLILFAASVSLKAQIDTSNNRNPTEEELDAKLSKLATLGLGTDLKKLTPTNGVMVTGTEQNCAGAIAVCAQSYTQTTSYTGPGTISELPSTCLLGGGETNSVWYEFTAQTTGTFGFTINTAKDYDWALYQMPATGCSGIPTAATLRCNFSGTLGTTGMIPSGTLTSATASQSPYCSEVGITAGITYVLIVNNWTADANGYTLTFTSGAGYASITDAIPPTINPPNSVVNNCNGTFTLAFSEPVKCSSIAANGSDFTLTGGGVITSATGVGCSGAGVAYTNSVTINYTVPSSGTFTLGVAVGSDGNTILDKCLNAMLTTQTVTVNVLNALTLTPSTTNICTAGTAVTLTAAGAPNSIGTYTLNPGAQTAAANGSGQATFTVNPSATTTYVVTMTYAGCTQSASTTITLVNNVIVSIDPVNPTLCPSTPTTTLTASTTINGVACVGCTFQWSGGSTATTATVSAGVGTYSVTTATSAGCVGTNTATSTVSLASAPAASACNIYYVNSVSGGGSCLSPSSPGGLTTALALASCNNAIIKIQTGIYTLTDKIDVGSYVTLEGGFNSTFTIKSSNLTGGTNSTTFRRSSGGDTGDATKCTAFKVAAASTSFRFQDLRIEMPGSPNVTGNAAGTGYSNYGIRMGAGCTSYNIVRCYIDAGAGSNP